MQAAQAGFFDALQRWLAAWRNLPDNPLAGYLALVLQRRQARTPLWRRRLGLLLGAGLICVAGGGLMFGRQGIFGTISNPHDFLGLALVLVGIPLFLAWLLQGLYTAIRACLALLAPGGRRAAVLQIDDMLSLTRLSAEEVVLAALRAIAPPLLLRALVGSILTGLAIVAMLYLDQGSSEELSLALLVLPLTILLPALAGCLALLCCLLFYLAQGRELRGDYLAGLAATLLTLAQLTWVVTAGWLIDSSSYMGDTTLDVFKLNGSLAVLLGGAAFALVCWLCCSTSTRSVLARGLTTAALPVCFLLPALLGVTLVGVLYLYDDFSPTLEALKGIWLNYIWWCGSWLAYNPLALPGPLAWGDYSALAEQAGDDVFYWTRLPLLFAGQGVMLWCLAQRAARSVDLRRRGG